MGRPHSTPAPLTPLAPQYGTRALSRVLTTILGQTDNRVPLPQGYPGGDAAFFRGEPFWEACGLQRGWFHWDLGTGCMGGLLGKGLGRVPPGVQDQRLVYPRRHEAGPALCGHWWSRVTHWLLGCGEG